MPCILTAIFLTGFEYTYEQSTAVLPHDCFHMGAKATLQDGDGDSGLLEQLFSYIVCLLFIFMSMMIFLCPCWVSFFYNLYGASRIFFKCLFFIFLTFFTCSIKTLVFSTLSIRLASDFSAEAFSLVFPWWIPTHLDIRFVFITPIPPPSFDPNHLSNVFYSTPVLLCPGSYSPRPSQGQIIYFFMTLRFLCPNSHVLRTLPLQRGDVPPKNIGTISVL